nr:Chain A, Cystine Knot Protein 2.5D [synthetic construct]
GCPQGRGDWAPTSCSQDSDCLAGCVCGPNGFCG